MSSWAAIAAGVLLLLVAAARRGDLVAAAGDAGPVVLDDGTEEQGQGGAVETASAALAAFDVLPFIMSTTTDPNTADDNVAAFLAMLRKAEGTYGSNAYRTMFGGQLFDDFSDHPRQAHRFTDRAGRTLWTSAAGAYQFMAVSPIPGGGSTKVNTWDRLAAKLGLPDFSPASQDAAAVQLIDECGALQDVRAGRVDDAVAKCRRIWASLPGAGYAQGERSLDYLRTAYATAGGSFA